MAAKLPSLLLFLFLLAFEDMIMMRPAEAAICSSPSRVFRGWCFIRSNCASICEKEGFVFGECKGLKCICEKKCNEGGGDQGPPGGGDPGQGPPDQGPPAGGDPGQGPPDGGDGPPDQGSDGGDGPPDQGSDGGDGPPSV